jgi:hypothetical protein
MSYPAPYKTTPTAASNCSRGESLPTQGPTTMTTSPRLRCFSLWIGRGHEPQPLVFNYSGPGGGTNAPTLSFLTTWDREGARLRAISRFRRLRTERGHDCRHPLVFNDSGPGGGTNAPTLSFLTLRTGWGHNCPHPLVFDNAWPGGGTIRCNLSVSTTQDREGARLPPHPRVSTIAGPGGDNNGPLRLKYI